MDSQAEDFDQPELPYQVRIENFEGPLDLLLHLIKKNEINIYDIPVAMIARQYLEYLEAMEELTRVWTNADSPMRKVITKASHQIDKQLANDPHKHRRISQRE